MDMHNQGTWLTELSFVTFALSFGPRLSCGLGISECSANPGQSLAPGQYGAEPNYMQTGFLSLQYSIDNALLNAFSDSSGGGKSAASLMDYFANMKLQRFPCVVTSLLFFKVAPKIVVWDVVCTPHPTFWLLGAKHVSNPRI